MKKQQSGFSSIELLVILIILSILGIASWRVYKSQQSKGSTDNSSAAIKTPILNADFCWSSYGVGVEESKAGVYCVDAEGKGEKKVTIPGFDGDTIMGIYPSKDLSKVAITTLTKPDASVLGKTTIWITDRSLTKLRVLDMSAYQDEDGSNGFFPSAINWDSEAKHVLLTVKAKYDSNVASQMKIDYNDQIVEYDADTGKQTKVIFKNQDIQPEEFLQGAQYLDENRIIFSGRSGVTQDVVKISPTMINRDGEVLEVIEDSLNDGFVLTHDGRLVGLRSEDLGADITSILSYDLDKPNLAGTPLPGYGKLEHGHIVDGMISSLNGEKMFLARTDLTPDRSTYMRERIIAIYDFKTDEVATFTTNTRIIKAFAVTGL